MNKTEIAYIITNFSIMILHLIYLIINLTVITNIDCQQEQIE